MPSIALEPTDKEIQAWLKSALEHVLSIEYYLHQLKVGKEDPQRPHDIVGPGNKLEWPVLRGFAIQYRDRASEIF